MLYQLSYTPALAAGAAISAVGGVRQSSLPCGAARCMPRHHMHSPARPPIPVETLLLAYRSGIFPMADRRDDPEVFWVEPRERAIIPLEGLHLSKSLKKVIRTDRFAVTVNRGFEQVIRACAEPRIEHPDTWISERIIQSYLGLHREGHAHSVECWQVGREGWPELVGGLYGVSFDRVFCGESMFSRVPDASKVALAWLVALMRRAGMALLDCQFMTEHLRSMGAAELAQADYRKLVERAQGEPRMTLDAAWQQVMSGEGYTAGAAGGAAGDGAADGVAVGLAAGAPLGASLGEAGPSSPGKRIVQSLTQTS
jgi:leucyl/phenylalanyl-tRNA---protein transferase